MVEYKELSAEEKITRTIIQLQKIKPFFSYILSYFRFYKRKKLSTMGVNQHGVIIYGEKWLDSLKEEDLRTILAHETLHVVLKHLERAGVRNKLFWNLAADMVVNDILDEDGFQMPNGGLTEFMGITGKKRSAEAVYEDIYKLFRQKKQITQTNAKKADDDRWDEHMIDEPGIGKGDKEKKKKEKKGNGKEDKEGQQEEIEAQSEMESAIEEQKDVDWERVIREAYVYSKQQGNCPAGIERLLDALVQSKLDWKSLLYKFITREIPIDYSWRRPHKRTDSLGIYLPTVVREDIDIIVAVDDSGSIGQKEFIDFMSEIASILRSFDSIKGTLIACDCSIHDILPLDNSEFQKILTGEYKLHGGGGTDFRPVFEWIKENKPNAKLIIYLTDGYGDFPEIEEVNSQKVIWVITEDGLPEHDFPFGYKVRLTPNPEEK